MYSVNTEYILSYYSLFIGTPYIRHSFIFSSKLSLVIVMEIFLLVLHVKVALNWVLLKVTLCSYGLDLIS